MFKITGFSIIFFFISTYVEAQELLRGPYLQMATSTSINIRWRTDVATISRVRYGTSSGSLINVFENLSPKTEHELKITGLSPNTFYWYNIESGSGVLQGDVNNSFKTLPNIGEKQLYRIGVFGDCGSNNANQLNVRNSVINYLGTNYMNAWILLGDNAYSNGTDEQYSAGFFNYYKDKFLKQNPLYPAPGNHDYDRPAGARTAHNNPYYSIFTMPTLGEAGGLPSGNEAYYSFDIGNIHFISLDSDGLHGPEGNKKKIYDIPNEQVAWLIQDLEANTNRGWVVAYFHHPPFTKGSHDSDNYLGLDGDLVEIRTKLIKILEDYGVDLILCGHSHVYERTKLIKGYYGESIDYNEPEYALSTSSAKYNGSTNSCPYYKNGSVANNGTLYVVAGSAGQRGGAGSIPGFPHNAMYYSNATEAGALMLEVEGSRLDAKWISQSGIIEDQFTMMKDVNRNTTYTTTVGSPVTLQASYIGSYLWTNAQTSSAITITPSTEGSEIYIVKDDKNCVADTFNVIASRVLPLTWVNIKAWYDKSATANLLKWETINEVNVVLFDIERSLDGINFTSIGIVNATRSSGANAYSFIDKLISADVKKYYYRIKQQDEDGKFTYSTIVRVDRLGDVVFNIQVIPNPGKPGQIRVRLTSDKKRNVLCNIVDVSGKPVMSKKILLSETVQTIIPNVQAGTYFVRIEYEGQMVTRKFIVE